MKDQLEISYVVLVIEMAANSHVTEPNLTLDQSIRDSSPIVIFQCKGCKSVLGDSSAFVASDRELEVICVNGMSM